MVACALRQRGHVESFLGKRIWPPLRRPSSGQAPQLPRTTSRLVTRFHLPGLTEPP